MKKIILFCLLEVVIVIVSIFVAFHGKCVGGIIGSSDDCFVILLESNSLELNHDLYFYDNNGNLKNVVKLQVRGGVKLVNYNDNLLIDNGLDECNVYDYNGNLIHRNVLYTEDTQTKYSFESENIKVYHLMYKDGYEEVVYEKNGQKKCLDINYSRYNYYKKYNSALYILFLNFFIIVFSVMQKSRKQQKVNIQTE